MIFCMLQTLSTAFGANFFTASPTVRNILSSPMWSVNFAAWSFWITAGPGLARISSPPRHGFRLCRCQLQLLRVRRMFSMYQILNKHLLLYIETR
uniref:Sfp1 n=1 Tax=Arundo donax TaxID=35708 RepID=A0A0A9C7Z1_ARUDO